MVGEINSNLFLALVTAFGVCGASVLVWLQEIRDAEFVAGILAIGKRSLLETLRGTTASNDS